jgi:hypothetical protein
MTNAYKVNRADICDSRVSKAPALSRSANGSRLGHLRSFTM